MTQLDVKYILFSHFNKKDGRPLEELKVFQKDLECLLDNPEHRGILMLFWHPGWLELLNTVGVDFKPMIFANEFNKAVSEKKDIEEFFAGTPLSDRLRLITANDLHPILNNLRGNRPGTEATRLRRFLDGNQDRTLYDTAKVVEAIVHLRNLGSSIPIIRVDWDVLFDKQNLEAGKLELAILGIKDQFISRQQNARMFSFMYSAKYLQPSSTEAWNPAHWMKAFATRPHPALTVDSALLADPISTFDVVKLKKYKNCFNVKNLENFYDVLPSIGSDSKNAVISGALLCMNDVAILDLPPCSNFDLNVMWIDDHLKYLLHQTLGHFKEYINPACPSQKLPNAISAPVNKERPDITDKNVCKDIAMYVLEEYLPILLRGCIFDFWICADKNDPENEPGVFTKILRDALKYGYLPCDKSSIKDLLEKAAIKRIEKVREAWSKLTVDGKDTFASLWVGVPSKIPERFKKGTRNNVEIELLSTGLLMDDKVTEITSVNNLSSPMQNDLDKLIDDALVYIEWSLYWPNFIQAVRSIEPGKLRVDLAYESGGRPSV